MKSTVRAIERPRATASAAGRPACSRRAPQWSPAGLGGGGGGGTRSCGSSPGEASLAGSVLEERGHADPGVLGGEHLGEELLLEVETAAEGHVEATVDGPLGQALGDDRTRGQLGRLGPARVVQARLPAPPRRPSRAPAPPRLPPGGPVNTRSLARAGPTSRDRRWVPPPPGMMPEQDLGLTQLRPLRSNAEVACQRQLAASAERVAGDRRDRGPGDVGDSVERPQEQLTDPRPRRCSASAGPRPTELGDLCAGSEDPVAACHHHGSRRIVGERLGRTSQLASTSLDRALTLGLSSRTMATPSSCRST